MVYTFLKLNIGLSQPFRNDFDTTNFEKLARENTLQFAKAISPFPITPSVSVPSIDEFTQDLVQKINELNDIQSKNKISRIPNNNEIPEITEIQSINNNEIITSNASTTKIKNDNEENHSISFIEKLPSEILE